MSTNRCRLTPRLLSWSWVSFLLVLLLSPLTASAVNLTGLSLAPPNPTLNITETLQLIATGSYDDGTQQVIAQAKQVSTGFDHSCAVNIDNTARCWGYNVYGQLGNGTITNSSTPVTVNGIGDIVSISTGSFHSCALLTDGTVRCWGYNLAGALGNGTTIDSSTPVVVSGINTAVAVSAGNLHTCAVLADGTVRCWGFNYHGQLGNGTFTGSAIPVTVSGISTAVAVSTGVGGDHTCARLANGTVQCWGANGGGQLGNGTNGAGTDSTTPVTVSGISTAVAISAGGGHSCAILAGGKLRCWGSNGGGQLGNGTFTDSSIPVTVSGISTAVAVSAGYTHTCALLADSTLRCWGSNSYGIGDGTPFGSSFPVSVSGISTAVAVSAGDYTCAVLSDSTVWCWGFNGFGELGNGSTDFYSWSPVQTLGYLPLTWNSSNPAVASVNSLGQAQALAFGTAQITVSTDSISASTTVTVLASTEMPPVASDVNATVVSGTSITWTPKVSDPNGDPITCRIGTPSQNGTATVASNCSSGTYQSNLGFIGTDTFTYLANDGQFDSSPGTVTVAVTEPQGDQACIKQYSVSQFTQTGKEGTLTISFTGNIVSYTNKVVKVCPGTTLQYQTSSTKGPVVCQVKNNTTRGSGSLKINDHMKCTDKPAGKDKVHFKVKSGVSQ